MPIHVALRHQTHYAYDRPTGHGPHVVRLRPAPHCRTNILSFSQKISGGEHFINWQQDAFANWNARLVFPGKLTEFSIEVEVIAEMAVYNPFDFFIAEEAQQFPFTYDPGLRKDLASFLEQAPPTPRFTAYLRQLRQEILGHPQEVAHAAAPSTGHRIDVRHDGGNLPPHPSPPRTPEAATPAVKESLRTIDLLVAINQRLQRDLKYVIRLEPGVQTPEETLARSSGSCRDSGWLLVRLLRHLGFAARFVSGYLVQLAPDVKALDGPSGTEVDFTDLHAWCEVYLPGAGWIGLDPTSGLLAGEGHIPLSCTPVPSGAAPVSGAIDECKSTMRHEMSVTRIYESPRVTKPYSEDQWSRMDALGDAIDADLNRQDVRLTMGGEPTFVSIDDPDGPEWNFTAVSEKKRVLSGILIKRLRDHFAPGSLLHYGQGKWYPGEPLPRWALGAYWRKDGVPIWRDASLIADESRDYGHGTAEARELLVRLTTRLNVDPSHILPGYEDIFYYTWKERRLPSNVTPERSHMKDKQERDRLALLFQRGLGDVVGYVLPIKRDQTGPHQRWISGSWFLRDEETLWLLPGDSPMGLRLPLDSLPWVDEKEFPWNLGPDPTQKFPPLPLPAAAGERPDSVAQNFIQSAIPSRPAGSGQNADHWTSETDPDRRPEPGQSAPSTIRTALCVEPRGGRIHLFLPPVSRTEDYLDLVSAIESTVREMGMPVIIEGEAPPRDPRIERMAVTPDPGVIEVNLPPSASWRELVRRTETLYEEARQTRLGTEKFMLDGRHTGTGGGNHILLGGATPGDSPVLRRPDLLRSLLAYWQNHPSLSWLFSGLFIGPTSQAPRVDEARHDSLYELEIAFLELDRQLGIGDGKALPWLVDRLFRNLLLDSSGNTHRSEFSIDKLYSPDTSSGRLGLVEMRAFEMPPHARMSLAQHLLLRGLVARFWREPYRNPLIRWGTDLHDRWMLPHFCETDFRDILRELGESGHPFEPGWFAPHFEFRFPRIGDFTQRDVRVELRTALEPWQVLGEEPAGGGNVRYVDSSLERLQVKVSGLVGDRFAITVNGRRVPLHPTGNNGEAVAGVRYRAWQPPNALQPTIGVHTPLTFDLHDTWNGRSLGGCTYHVAHPGGLSHSSFPVNAYEAESRRLARFQVHGHTQGSAVPVPSPLSREFPFTLDLRNTA